MDMDKIVNWVDEIRRNKSQMINNIDNSYYTQDDLIKAKAFIKIQEANKSGIIDNELMEKININSITNKLNDNFNKGLISEDLCKSAFNELDELIKAKYYKREGTPGNYKYYYTEEQYKKAKGEKQDKEKTNNDIKQKKLKEKIEKINEINKKYNQDYQFNVSGRIFRSYMGKKLWFTFDEIVKDWESFEREKNARENVKKASEFIEKNGGEIIYKSMYGSKYYSYKGYKVRISNHHWTSEKHDDPDYNIYSYKKDGHISMIEEIKKIGKKAA
jgi:hypothetical protein